MVALKLIRKKKSTGRHWPTALFVAGKWVCSECVADGVEIDEDINIVDSTVKSDTGA